ncbi:MAG: hypothetical protein WA637_17660, partial [Terriglobales bacterium]
MARYRISDRLPRKILDLAETYYPIDYPFEKLLSSRFHSDEQFAADLRQRFKKMPYPYDITRAQVTKSQSTYEVLEKRGALRAILSESVVSQLRIRSTDPDYWLALRQIHDAGTELGKKFRRFHIPFAKELLRHTTVVQKLKAEYELGEELIGRYLYTAEQLLMSEAALLRIYIEEKPQSAAKVIRESVEKIYSEVSRAFEKAKITNRALCCHVTSIICSHGCLTTKTLLPTPERVRKLLERNPVK